MKLRTALKRLNLLASVILGVIVYREMQKSARRWKAERDSNLNQQAPGE